MQKDNQERQHKTKAERARFLNVIYFIDSNRTHTFQLKLKWSLAIAATVASLILWSFMSTFLLIHESRESTSKSQRIRGLLATIFNYQTRYDHVYERSYPEEANQDDIAEAASESDEAGSELADKLEDQASESIAAKPSTPVEEPMSLAARSQPIVEESPSQVKEIQDFPPLEMVPEIPTPLLQFQLAHLSQDEEELVMEEVEPEAPVAADEPVQAVEKKKEESKTASKNAEESKADKAPPIAIEDIKSIHHEDQLEFKFALKNTDSPNLASGYVIGVAVFRDSNGHTLEIASPPNITKINSVPFSRLSRNHRFSIRYYKTKVLIFAKPEGKTGSFEEVSIIIGNAESQRREFVYNLKEEKMDAIRDMNP
ncbi:MAG: hypothetical protein ACOH5I_24620 [Oligoflexus sp.]